MASRRSINAEYGMEGCEDHMAVIETTLKYGDIEILMMNCPEDTVYLMALSDEQIKKARKFGIDVKRIDPKQIVQVKNV